MDSEAHVDASEEDVRPAKGGEHTSHRVAHPALYSKEISLREKHQGVMKAILHRLLEEGDYYLAGRTWGLLLRSMLDTRPSNMRKDGQWGIGAEILLQRGNNTDFARNESFRTAREYYERLILQFPAARSQREDPNNASLFYPAMFSLWIYETCDRAKRCDSRSQARAIELEGAKEIKQRLDRLFLSPPYDRSAELRELHRMVESWIADLEVERVDDDDTEMVSPTDESVDTHAAFFTRTRTPESP
jgi:hypothetical protein